MLGKRRVSAVLCSTDLERSQEFYEQKVGLARRMVSDDPRQVAQVVRNWVGEDGG